ncbi:MAG TPA: hypothetical protein DCE78_02975 [Bacteroidetes bacterium]|nr:hypothetical protein [Bacteroidota bacterium]
MKKKLYNKIKIMGVGIAILTMSLSMSPIQTIQAQDAPEYNKWGVDVGLSAFMGKKSDAWSPFTGQMDVESGYFTPGLQANIRYYLSPAFSFQLGADYVKLSDDGESNRTFDNDLLNLTLRANVYLGRLFEFGNPKWSPNFHFGFGRAFSSLSNVTGEQDSNVDTGNYYFGTGIRRNLTDRIDFYTEYSYHIFTRSNIDGFEFDSDRLGRLTAGISFKLGSSDRPHAEWYPSNTNLYATRTSLERTNSMLMEYERRIAEQDSKINSLESELNVVQENDCCGDIRILEEKVESLNNEINTLKSSYVPATQTTSRDGYFMQTVPDGYYVQVFADYTLERAQYALELTKEHFNKNNPGNHNYVITKTPTGTWHIVLIGPYQGFSLTHDILRTAKTLFDDSYVEHFE